MNGKINMHPRSTDNNWTKCFSSPTMVTYNASANRLGITCIKIEKCREADKYKCSVILPETSKQAFLNAFRSNLNQFIKYKEVNLFGNFYLLFDDKDIDVMKGILATANSSLPFDPETKKAFLEFIKADDLTPPEGVKCALV